MNRIKRTSIDIKNFKDLIDQPSQAHDTQLVTLQRLEFLIASIQQIIKFLSETPLIYETQRYGDPLHNLVALHRSLRARYTESHPSPFPSSTTTTTPTSTTTASSGRVALVDEGVLRLVQYTQLIPLSFYKEKSGGAVHGLQTIESRKKVLAYAKVLRDRSETILEIAQVPIP